tara:strand:- start:36 stop:323 length:288 start_codon:yes stop_codon:yes gene_type:complete
MRKDFRPNLRIITNILSVIATFMISINLIHIAKKDKNFNERRDDCADVVSGAISFDKFIKKYNIGENDEKIVDYPITSLANNFCRFYAGGGFGGI